MREIRIKTGLVLFGIISGLTFVRPLLAQDSTGVQVKEQKGYSRELQEQDLGAIYVKAIIEKPSVSILPIREEPETGEIEMIARSFTKEIKKGPRKLFYMEEEEAVEKIERAKKMLTIKRK